MKVKHLRIGSGSGLYLSEPIPVRISAKCLDEGLGNAGDTDTTYIDRFRHKNTLPLRTAPSYRNNGVFAFHLRRF